MFLNNRLTVTGVTIVRIIAFLGSLVLITPGHRPHCHHARFETLSRLARIAVIRSSSDNTAISGRSCIR